MIMMPRFPPELIIIISQHLDIPTIRSLSLTCRTNRDALLSLLFRNIVINDDTIDKLQEFPREMGDIVRHITWGNRSELETQRYSDVTTWFPNVKSLRIIISDVDDGSFEHLSPLLASLSILPLEELSLCLACPEGIVVQPNAFDDLPSLPPLQKLSVQWDARPSAESLCITLIRSLVANSKDSLIDLAFFVIYMGPYISDIDVLPSFVDIVPNITQLSLSGPAIFISTLDDAVSSSIVGLVEKFSGLTRLETLALGCQFEYADDDDYPVLRLGRLIPAVRELSVSCTKLQNIYWEGCEFDGLGGVHDSRFQILRREKEKPILRVFKESWMPDLLCEMFGTDLSPSDDQVVEVESIRH